MSAKRDAILESVPHCAWGGPFRAIEIFGRSEMKLKFGARSDSKFGYRSIGTGLKAKMPNHYLRGWSRLRKEASRSDLNRESEEEMRASAG